MFILKNSFFFKVTLIGPDHIITLKRLKEKSELKLSDRQVNYLTLKVDWICFCSTDMIENLSNTKVRNIN